MDLGIDTDFARDQDVQSIGLFTLLFEFCSRGHDKCLELATKVLHPEVLHFRELGARVSEEVLDH